MDGDLRGSGSVGDGLVRAQVEDRRRSARDGGPRTLAAVEAVAEAS